MRIERKSIRLNVFGRFLALLGLGALAGCGSDKPAPAGPVTLTATRLGMGTLVETEVTAPDSAAARAATDAALDEMERLYALFDPAREGSGIKAINDNAGKKAASVPPEVYAVLQRAQQINEKTKGVFDITVKPLLDLWLAEGDTFAIPSKGMMKATKSLVWAAGLELQDGTVHLKHELMGIDVSGIATGYILDRMAAVLKKRGAVRARIRAGNDLRLVGTVDNSWQVPLQAPRPDGAGAVLTSGRGGVCTARDDVQFFDRNGVRYHHILDPRTGNPAEASICVTVWTGEAMDADALATGIFVLGPDEGMRLVESLKDVEAVIYYLNEDKVESVVSSGFDGKLQ